MEWVLGHNEARAVWLHGWLGGWPAGRLQAAPGAVSRAAISVAARSPDSTAPSR